MTSVWDNTEEKVKIFDAFLHEGPDIVMNIPSSVEVTESCNISVSQHTRNLHIIRLGYSIQKDTPLLRC